MTEPEEGVVGTLNFIAGWSKVQVATWDLQVMSPRLVGPSPQPEGTVLTPGG